jgi:hypothetical protein
VIDEMNLFNQQIRKPSMLPMPDIYCGQENLNEEEEINEDVKESSSIKLFFKLILLLFRKLQDKIKRNKLVILIISLFILYLKRNRIKSIILDILFVLG